MQGNLTQNQLPDVIQTLGRDRESGVLQLSRDDVSKRIYFGHGSMVFTRSTVYSDRLGEMLLRKGELTRSNLALASNKMRTRREKINYHPHSGWFDEGPSKGPFSARVQPKERGRVDARSLITYGA